MEGLGYFVECVKIEKIRVYFPTLLPLLNDFLLVPEEIVEEKQTKGLYSFLFSFSFFNNFSLSPFPPSF